MPSTDLAELQCDLDAAMSAFSRSITEIEKLCSAQQPCEVDGPEYAALSKLIDELMRTLGGIETRAATNGLSIGGLRKHLRDKLGHWFLLGALNSHAIKKPFGYAGDYKMIDMILTYQPAAGGMDSLVDEYLMQLEAAQTVVSRRSFMVSEITGWIENRPNGTTPPTIVSIGCGPAAEICDMALMSEFAGAHFILVDLEDEALETASGRLRALPTSDNFTFETYNDNLVKDYLAPGFAGVASHFNRPIDVIYSVGVMDYLSDKVFIRSFELLCESVRDSGICCLGNFGPRNSSRIYMDWVLDWPLYYRTQEALRTACPVSSGNIELKTSGVNNFISVSTSDR